jgi:hypothetical protein
MRRLAVAALAALALATAGASPALALELDAAATDRDGNAVTQAGAHPYALELDLRADQALRSGRISLPPGLLVNPTQTSECSFAAFHTPRSSPYEASASGEDCPNSSQVGVVAVDAGGTVSHFGLFNLGPAGGTLTQIGASPFGLPLVFAVRLREGDYGLDLELGEVPASPDLRGIEATIWGTPWWGDKSERPSESHDPLRGDCLNEQTGGSWGSCLVFGSAPAPSTLTKSYLTLPTTPCAVPPTFSATVTSWAGATEAATATITPLVNCNKALTTPKVQLMTEAAAARTGLAFNLDVNDGGGILNPGGIARPALKTAVVSLPEGLTINPSLGAGLGSCGEAEWARETATSEPGAGCPNSSKIGSVVLDGTLGLPDQLTGSIYLARPNANPFGKLIAVYMLARLPSRGLIVKSQGYIEPDPTTGRLVATFDELPRLLYTHFGLTLREGQRSTLLSPPACGTYTADLQTASWAEPATFAPSTSYFLITRGDGGAPCPSGGLPFAPRILAGSISAAAGAYTPFYLRLDRGDSEQEITSYSASFPPGLLGNLSGLATCSDEAIAAAARRSGAKEQAAPSCPAASSIGHTIAGYGVGGTLAWAPGGLYLAGPYHGAPLSVVAIDAATIGPFDLGTVVVRQAIRIDRRSAQVSLDPAGSDPIPHILAGIPLHLRDIRVYIDRPNFMVDPTSCDPMQVSSHLGGAGSNPFDPNDDSGFDAAERYQVIGCTALGFRPGLTLRLRGSVRHGGHPALQAVYRPRRGANLQAVSVTLPPSAFLAQEHIDGVCTRVQFNADSCPPGSIYGNARAVTPLLDEPLEGPVYLRSSHTQVPDLVADLRGRGIEIEVPGRIDSSRGRIRANFEALPDAPVTSFTMNLFGGKRGLIANAEVPCRGVHRANLRAIAQSNLTAVLHPPVKARCGGRGKHPEKHSRAAASAADIAQKGNLRVSFSGDLRPKTLPRKGAAPISVALGGQVSTTDGSDPPSLGEIEIAINRAGRLDPKALPTCRLEEIQPASTAYARRACASSRVGEGTFSAAVSIPEQSPYPSRGTVTAFNGEEGGRPVIFLHIYGTEPLPTSFTLPLTISRGPGTFGTVLRGALPDVDSHIGFVTGISLRLGGAPQPGRRPYLSAGCPAPKGFRSAVFPLARASFDFSDGRTLGSTLVRTCTARG